MSRIEVEKPHGTLSTFEADGVMVEVHPDPSKALSDGRQSLHYDEFSELMGDVRRLAEFRAAVGV